MIFSLVAMIGLEKCCITSACLQWLCHSGEQTMARGPLVVGVLILVSTSKILAELWPFFDLVFVGVLILVPLSNFSRDALILLKVCRRIYYCNIQVKSDIGNHLQNFGQVMALFLLSGL